MDLIISVIFVSAIASLMFWTHYFLSNARLRIILLSIVVSLHTIVIGTLVSILLFR